jgi:hypothetical protein
VRANTTTCVLLQWAERIRRPHSGRRNPGAAQPRADRRSRDALRPRSEGARSPKATVLLSAVGGEGFEPPAVSRGFRGQRGKRRRKRHTGREVRAARWARTGPRGAGATGRATGGLDAAEGTRGNVGASRAGGAGPEGGRPGRPRVLPDANACAWPNGAAGGGDRVCFRRVSPVSPVPKPAAPLVYFSGVLARHPAPCCHHGLSPPRTSARTAGRAIAQVPRLIGFRCPTMPRA